MADEVTERTLLGAVLLGDSPILEAVRPFVAAEHFSKAAHRHVFGAYVALTDVGKSIDLVSVKGELTRRGVFAAIGGYSFLIALAEASPLSYSAAQARADARHIRDAAGPPGF